MLKIKTVVCPFSMPDKFDKKVSGLILNGWKLKKRGITTAQGEPNEVGSYAITQVLYAELEKS